MVADFLRRISSRKFLVTILGVALILILKSYGMPDNAIAWLVGLIGGYLGIEGLKDIVAVLKISK